MISRFDSGQVLLHEKQDTPQMMQRGYMISPGFVTRIDVAATQVKKTTMYCFYVMFSCVVVDPTAECDQQILHYVSIHSKCILKMKDMGNINGAGPRIYRTPSLSFDQY